MEKEFKEKFSVEIRDTDSVIAETEDDNKGLTEEGYRVVVGLDEYSIIKTSEEYDIVNSDTENAKLVNTDTLYIEQTPRPIRKAGANKRAKLQIDLLNIFASKNNSIKKTQKLLIYNIKAYCRYNHIKAIDFAESINVTRQYISQIEAGKKIPSLDVICCIAKEMNISVGVLLSAKYPFTYSLETATLLSAVDNKPEKRQREYFKKLLTIAKSEEDAQ